MDTADRLPAALKAAGIPFTQNEPLRLHTTFKIGGDAAFFCTPQTTAQLAAALAVAKENGAPCYLLGEGSNVLFADDGYRGMVVHPAGQLCQVGVQGHTLVAGAGATLKTVCEAAQKAGLSGLEFAYGIPGSTGGAVYMNAGAYGGEVRQVLKSVTLLDASLTPRQMPVDLLGLEYRDSAFQHNPWYILEAVFELSPGDPAQIARQMDHNMALRRQKQPLELPSAGSAFKRPSGAFAGQLIDQSGLRGYRVGDAAISEKHCGFIVNLGRATCRDVLELATHVVETVKRKTGYTLEREIRVVSDAL